ncbi:hypothetical protein RCL1_000423 [Eukaryota sp. TZLM3-RCL]
MKICTTIKQVFFLTFLGLFVFSEAAFVLKSVLRVGSFREALDLFDVKSSAAILAASFGDLSLAHPMVLDWLALLGLVVNVGTISWVSFKVLKLVLRFLKAVVVALVVGGIAALVYFVLVKTGSIARVEWDSPVINFSLKTLKILQKLAIKTVARIVQ